MKKYKKTYQKLFRATLATTVATGALVAAVPAYTNAAEVSFSDVKETHHFYESVMSLTARGVINGYEDGTYRPGENISRAHAAKIMALALNLDTENVKDPGFKDVKKDYPYYGHIAALVEAGIIKGYEDGTFRPNGNLTRAHIAQMLVLGFEFEEETLSNLPFTDVNDKQWFANHIQTLYSNEITTGTSTTTFSPNAFVTRGQVASFIYRSELAQTKGVEVIGFADDKLELADGTYSVHADLQDIFNEANLPALKGALVKVNVENDTIVGVTSIELKANGTASNAVTLDGNGSTLNGNVIVNGDYVALKNITVKGNLEIGAQVANSFTADKVTVTGKTIISDKAASAAVFTIAAVAKSPTIVFNNSTMGTVEVTKKGATIEAKGTTKVQEIVLSSNVTLKADTGITIPKVSVKTGASQVTLDANVGSLNVNSAGNLTLAGTGDIKEVKVESQRDVAFETKGKIEKLTVNLKDTKVSLGTNTRVVDIALPAGTSAGDIIQNFDKVKENIEKIGGKANPDAKPAAPAAGGGGGGGGGGAVGDSDGTPQLTGTEVLNNRVNNEFNKQAINGKVKVQDVTVILTGTTFEVEIPSDSLSTYPTFKTAAGSIFTAFNGAKVTKVNTIDITDAHNALGFGDIFDKILGYLGVDEFYEIKGLKNSTVPVNVKGEVDGKEFNVTYTFEFK
ncbi:S-layer homology domain-containing protein [Sporosarcina sp. UB5]|uniref:S-layer homology domain-containing protein n=1 Tax=Sporosarcina sp. UB5 TaxID=3047463 RepID=UPI003D7A66D0